MSFAGAACAFFSSSVGISGSHFGIAKDAYNSRRVRMHPHLFAGFEAVFKHSHLIIFEQDFVNVTE